MRRPGGQDRKPREQPDGMFQALVTSARRWLNDLHRSWLHRPLRAAATPEPRAPLARPCERLQRVILTDEVSRTLFEEYAAHRQSQRGDEETGWVLMGVREVSDALVLATLPAGARRVAGVAHVRFNSNAQAVASRIVRQWDRRLTILGVLHTHPGSLRHPSDGDFRGDSQWVSRLRGSDGVFGIGTADAAPGLAPTIARQPRDHIQCLGELCLSWYGLHAGDSHYRPLTVQLTLGPDLARPLHVVWTTLEHHAEALDRLCRQQAGVTFAMVEGDYGPALAVDFPLAQTTATLRLVLERKEARYYLARGDELTAIGPPDERVDRGVYLLLAELAGLA